MRYRNAGELIDAMGGTAAVARALGVRNPSVAEWRRGGIPTARLWRLAVLAEQRGIAPRWEVAPNDWHLIWPELIGADGAPQVSDDKAEVKNDA